MTPCGGTIAVRGTGLAIARLGFGCARVFGGGETRSSTRLLEAALAAGLSHFDTAPSYSYGQSETMLGEVLAGVAGVTITTKVGLSATGAPSLAGTLYRRFARPALARSPALKAALLRARERPAAEAPQVERRILGSHEIEASVAASMARLGRSQIDILLLHEPDQFVIDDALAERFEALKRNGTILAYGLGYGGMAPANGSFGQILQGAYDPATVGPASTTPTAIYHGVLRHRGPSTPREAVRAAMRAQPQAALIVSASTPSQVREIASQVKQGAHLPPSNSPHQD